MSQPLELMSVLLFGAQIALIIIVALGIARSHRPDATRLALLAGAGLTSWLAAVSILAARGSFMSITSAPPPIGPAIALPLALGSFALIFLPMMRRFATSIPQPWLIIGQFGRALNLSFLYLISPHILPSHFAIPLALGDFLIGGTAPLLAWAFVTKNSVAFRPWLAIWNVLGIADLAMALALGALSDENSLRLIFTEPSTAAMGSLPLVLVPAFGVPLYILLHLTSLLKLRIATPAKTGVFAPQAM